MEQPVDWLALSVALASGADGGETLDQETQAELELLLGRKCLATGGLDRAAELFVSAAEHMSPERKGEAAEQLLRVAKAWMRQKGDRERDARAEGALRAAVDLAPGRATAALAQHLQRTGQNPEAIDRWREAIRLNPQESNHHLSLARLYEQAGQGQEALTTYLELIESVPAARNYLVVAQRLDGLEASLPPADHTRSVKIALLGNATLDHLQSYVKVECYRAGLRPQMYQSGFDQYTQEVLSPESALCAFEPDVVICAIHASRLFPQIHNYPYDLTADQRRAEVNAGLQTVQHLVDALTERSAALVLLHNMVTPRYPALGIQDWREELGQAELFGQINAALAALARSRYRNVYIVDEDRVQARCGKDEATDPRLWLTARIGWSEEVLAELAREYVRYLRPYKALTRKCVVLDLDNTLWGGVVGEDGTKGIQLGPEAPGNAFLAFQRELERLWRRGILLAICSKNNEDDVLPMFERHPHMALKLSHFAARRINWESKADNLRAIARELNIGLDSLVFLDDNPVERASVRAELPSVLIPELPVDPAYYRQALLELDVFDTLSLTEEDRRRNQLYAEQRARREAELGLEAGGRSLEEYLAQLEMVVEIEPAHDGSLPRIAQLTNKTNQFNLTTRRYSEAEIAGMLDSGWKIYSVRVADRFGDNGIVGVAIVEPQGDQTWELDTLLLSCRVMGRGVETALLAFLLECASEAGIRRLLGRYVATAKNVAVKDLFSRHGFTRLEGYDGGSALWELHVAEAGIRPPGWLRIRAPQIAVL